MNGQRIQWDAKYLAQCYADEIKLASVHETYCRRTYSPPIDCDRMSSLRPGLATGRGFDSRYSRTTVAYAPPFWRRSWTAAGALIAELGLSVRQDNEEGTVSVGNGSRRRDVTESFADHPDKDAAIWAAIVRAAIRVCAEAREAA
jgi:hypothetical protein